MNRIAGRTAIVWVLILALALLGVALEEQMRDLIDAADAAEYIPGIKAAYNDWISDINEKTAEVMAMISMYK